MKDNQAIFTKYYMQFCYPCQDAHACDTEQKCVACWEQQGLIERGCEFGTTKELLRAYSEG